MGGRESRYEAPVDRKSVEIGDGTAAVVGVTYVDVGVTAEGEQVVRGADGRLFKLVAV